MNPTDVRLKIVERLERDLVGPDAVKEVLENRPSDVYLSGILWPIGDRIGGEDDDSATGGEEEDDVPATPGLSGQQRPCTMGISFATTSKFDEHIVDVELAFATYAPEAVVKDDGKRGMQWARREFTFNLAAIKLSVGAAPPLRLEQAALIPKVELHIRGMRAGIGLLSTVTVINRSNPEERNRQVIECHTIFQARIKITPATHTRIIARPAISNPSNIDEEMARLLFRDCPEFATGHQCSVDWTVAQDLSNATSISTRWLPHATVPAVRASGHKVFENAVQGGAFKAKELASVSDAELIRRLDLVRTSYLEWIELQRSRIKGLPSDLQKTAESNIATCEQVLERIADGIVALNKDVSLMQAFRLTNAAMALQHDWKRTDGVSELTWYPFQLAFILLAARSACDPTSSDRKFMDLLWFPTGGGKTEAYLAIIGVLAFYRRISSDDASYGAGTAAIMRYTLRLLTAQQFERASSLILACDLIRSGKVPSIDPSIQLGNVPFSIGLWVGGDATPNDFKKALETRGQTEGTTAEQITTCPCCKTKLRWDYDEVRESVRPLCSNGGCMLGPEYGPWPVFTVDTDVYRERPTLLIGTIDKFALVPLKKEIVPLFGLDGTRPPDLIIQDELHLISGPLGTVAGLYETAFDWLLSRGECRPKVIGSTATIRRASEQIRQLFDRDSCQFPPPGLDHNDSGFAVEDPTRAGRVYVGVTTSGRSAKFALQAVSGSLLQSGGASAVPDPAGRDGYSTLLCYFNSLRELGGAIVQMLDDVPDSIDLFANRHSEAPRLVKEPKELTSGVSQKQIVQTLAELNRSTTDPDCVDVVLATNMVSVGVDVPRLGMMVVNGQPKTRSEYIQATSRVGRSRFPGLVVSVLNAAKARDRSHFETFRGWHANLYRDVEATSVTPFASRARDRALHAVLVSMLRHGDSQLRDRPDLSTAPNRLLKKVVSEIERRVNIVDPQELAAASAEIDELLQSWDIRNPIYYYNDQKVNKSLMQSAERYARRRAAGRNVGAAWPTMNNMRSVEPSSRFRMTEVLTPPRGNQPSEKKSAVAEADRTLKDETPRAVPRWRR